MKKYYRLIKRVVKTIFGNDFFAKTDCDLESVCFGSRYGGWNVVVDRVNENSIIYSFGVGEDISFDLELIQKYNAVVHAFDPTPRSIEWVRGQGVLVNFILHQYGLADFDGEIFFYPPENQNHVPHTIVKRPKAKSSAIRVPVKSIRTIMGELGHSHVDIMKMDIEGAEYQVIDDSRTFRCKMV